MQQAPPALFGQGAELVVELAVRRERALVREHEVHAGGEGLLQGVARVVRRDVHEDRVGQGVPGGEIERLARAGLAAPRGLGERGAGRFGRGERREARRRQPAGVEHEAAPVHRGHDLHGEGLALELRDHRRERAADLSEAEQHDVRPRAARHRAAADLGKLEGVVHHALRARGVARVHDDRDVQLGRAPGDGDDVDPGLRQRPEHPRRDPRRPRHPQPDDDERRDPGAHLDAVDLPPRDLALELLDEARAGALGRRFGNAEADGVLRRRLGDERDRDPLAVDGGEGARRDAGDAQHPVPLHREQRLPRHRGERLHGIGVEGAAP